jgi:hypothetical protein
MQRRRNALCLASGLPSLVSMVRAALAVSSVVGKPVRSASLSAGTLKVKGDTVCASLRGIPIEPCFNLNKTDDQSFRGSISGLDFAYCDFTQLSDVAARPPPHRSGPLSLDPTRRRAGP